MLSRTAMMKGEPEFRGIVGVQLREHRALVITEQIQPDRGLFGGRFRRQLLRCGQFPREIRVRGQHGKPLFRRGSAEYSA